MKDIVRKLVFELGEELVRSLDNVFETWAAAGRIVEITSCLPPDAVAQMLSSK